MSSRKYLKRIWRVPKDRGALEYFATLVIKALRKHGWPADFERLQHEDWAFKVVYAHPDKKPPGDDFWQAVSIAVQITARTYRLDVAENFGVVVINRNYIVTTGGHFREERKP